MDVLLPSHTVEDNHDAVLLSGCTIPGSLHFLQNNAQKYIQDNPRCKAKSLLQQLLLLEIILNF